MKWIIILTIFAFLLVIYLYNKGRKDAYEEPSDGTVIKYPEVDMSIMDDHLDEMFQENDMVDEFSPEHLQIDETLKIINLRKKLKDIDLDYQNYEGK